MYYPKIGKQPRRTVRIPDLSGGLNLRDGLSLINDNQMTDCKNMWYKDGVLKTRPEVQTGDTVTSRIVDDKMQYLDFVLSRFDKDNTFTFGTETYVLRINIYVLKRIDLNTSDSFIHLEYINENDVNDIIDVGEFTYPAYFNVETDSLLVIKHNKNLLCFYNFGGDMFGIHKFKNVTGTKVFEGRELAEEDMHVPLIAINCQSATLSPFAPGGTMINGYNLLGNYYKAEYKWVNDSGEAQGSPIFMLFHPIMYQKQVDGKTKEYLYDYAVKRTITVETVRADGKTAIHKVTPEQDSEGNVKSDTLMETSANETDGILISVGRDGLSFLDAQGNFSENTSIVKITITAPCPNTSENKQKVFNMTKSAWFGGAAYGIYGGSRLFLGGNTLDGEQSLVVWSDLNNPLYFSENNYTYVGDKTQAVTAFGRQSENLVIFKEREIFQTQYVSGDTPTAEDLINQNVIDLSTQMAYFPITQVHGYIGCDCPETVQLCRNRLVWLNSDGKVYTLVSQNQYNERSVFEVSQMIEKKLSKEMDLRSALSADYDDHYMLFVGNKVYVMDYNCYGYTHVYSYSKKEDANEYIPWYYWELPLNPVYICGTPGRLLISTFDEHKETLYGGDYVKSFCMGLSFINDDEGNDCLGEFEYIDGTWKVKTEDKSIESLVQTKLFDFGAPEYYKNVDLINISLGNNGGTPIAVQYVTDNGTEQDEIVMTGNEIEENDPGYIKCVSRFPCIRSALRFGVRLSCDGPMAIDGISLNYRILGGAR